MIYQSIMKKELTYNANVKKLTWENYLLWNENHKKTIQDNQKLNANYKILGQFHLDHQNIFVEF